MTIGFATLMGKLAVAVRPFESCTWKIRGNGKKVEGLDPKVEGLDNLVVALKVEGVPEIDPSVEFSCRPEGRFPVCIDQVYGAAPPVAVRAAE
jgi:hypothetical protein